MWAETFKSHEDKKPFGPAAISLDISFADFQHVYGIPEHATSLALKSTKGSEPYRLYNLDVFEYELDNPMALYGSIPFMTAHSAKHTVGVFWLNAAEMFVDVDVIAGSSGFMGIGSSSERVDTHWIAETGIVDAYFFFGPTPQKVIQQYTALTGTTALPQSFAIAYHQCRWNYNDEADVAAVDAGFDEHDIPYDVLWLDIEHTEEKKYFTWDKIKFPNPVAMQEAIAAKHRKVSGRKLDMKLER